MTIIDFLTSILPVSTLTFFLLIILDKGQVKSLDRQHSIQSATCKRTFAEPLRDFGENPKH